MIRQVDISEISDGRLYSRDDMVKLGCAGCEGCSACCHGMGDSIILDPLDVVRLGQGCGESFSEMLDKRFAFGFVDGAILPHMKLTGEEEACTFLDANGRCSIHPYRPGFCRLFPLGRYYVDDGFAYILQKGECPREGSVKVKVKNWVDTPSLPRYERFVLDWHRFIRDLGEKMSGPWEFDRSGLSLYVLKLFYEKPYEQEKDFYAQFYARLAEARDVLDSL